MPQVLCVEGGVKSSISTMRWLGELDISTVPAMRKALYFSSIIIKSHRKGSLEVWRSWGRLLGESWSPLALMEAAGKGRMGDGKKTQHISKTRKGGLGSKGTSWTKRKWLFWSYFTELHIIWYLCHIFTFTHIRIPIY